MSRNKRTERIPVQVTAEEKEEIEKRAKGATMKTGPFLRALAFSDEKLVLLNESGTIAALLTKISINLERALRGKDITTELEKEMLADFKIVKKQTSEILCALPAILNDDDDSIESESDEYVVE